MASPETLRLSGIVRESIVDGNGLRFVVFCQGCPHHCPGCHNPQTHDFSGGKDVPLTRILAEIVKNPLLQGVTFSGGEPFCQAGAFAELARRIKALPGRLDVTVYSGYTYKELARKARTDPDTAALLKAADYLVDGPYQKDQRDLTLRFRGSRNQRYLDLRQTLRTGVPTPAPERPLPARLRYSNRTA